MNKLIKLGSFLLIVIMAASCADEALAPPVTFESATIGAYIRQVEIRTAEYDLANLGTTAVDFSVDFVDAQDGALVNEYVIDVQYIDNDPSNDDNSAPRQAFRSWSKSDFSTSARGNPGVDVNIPLSDVMTLLGLDPATLSPGDAIAFFGTITLDDGSKYASTNSTGTIRGSAFQGLFDLNANVTCPISDDIFSGSYTMTLTSGTSTFGNSALPVLGEVTLAPIAGSSTKRSISGFSILPAFGVFEPVMTIDFVCDKVVVVTSTPATGCPVTLVGEFNDTSYENPADITNDMTFDLTWVEDGSVGCGFADLYSATLVKN